MRIFISIKPDIVHLVTIKPVIIGGIVARLSKVPSVVAAVSKDMFSSKKENLLFYGDC